MRPAKHPDWPLDEQVPDHSLGVRGEAGHWLEPAGLRCWEGCRSQGDGRRPDSQVSPAQPSRVAELVDDELAKRWGVSDFTISAAMRILADEGLIVGRARSKRVVHAPDQVERRELEPAKPQILRSICGPSGRVSTKPC